MRRSRKETDGRVKEKYYFSHENPFGFTMKNYNKLPERVIDKCKSLYDESEFDRVVTYMIGRMVDNTYVGDLNLALYHNYVNNTFSADLFLAEEGSSGDNVLCKEERTISSIHIGEMVCNEVIDIHNHYNSIEKFYEEEGDDYHNWTCDEMGKEEAMAYGFVCDNKCQSCQYFFRLQLSMPTGPVSLYFFSHQFTGSMKVLLKVAFRLGVKVNINGINIPDSRYIEPGNNDSGCGIPIKLISINS